MLLTSTNNDPINCWDWALKSMTWYNKIGIHYLFNDVPISLLSILIPCIILYEHYCLHLLNCTWIRCIRSCIEDLSGGFLANRLLVHNQFMGLGNPLEVVVHHLLIGGMVSLGYRDGFPMVSALVCMVTHWTGPTVSYDLRLLVMTLPSCFIMLSLNLERILSLC